MTRIGFLAFLILALSSCATVPPPIAHIDLQQKEGSVLEYRQGAAVAVSTGARSISAVILRRTELPYGNPRFGMMVRVENRGSDSFDFSEANVSAFENGRPLYVLPASQVLADIHAQANRQRTAAAFAGVAGVIAAQGAGNTNYSGSVNGSVVGPSGAVQVQGTYTGVGTNQAATQRAQQQAVQQAADRTAAINASERAAAATAEQGLIQRTTLHPGEALQGYIVITSPMVSTGDSMVTLRIGVGGDVHEFSARVYVTRQ